ncbi:MAG: DUF4105 domain-containing protein [Flavobacteriales bacterium]|nr:DUF4105 domain-containing protein [Flavobacteriales bacterium]
MKNTFTLLFTLFTLTLSAHLLTNDAYISILTCEPGEELYSVFGHNAIRIYEPGQFDIVYNYGTFEFSDDFYMQFAQGKLNYKLSRSGFPDFNYEYLMTNRAVDEQILALDSLDKQRLFDLLEENYLPENRYYLYDFFYDNCATRIRDMLEEALGDRLQWHSKFPENEITFRDMIQRYLGNMHWGDFGIDLALGMPCDKLMTAEQNMFLPDEVMFEADLATLDGHPLVLEKNELLLSQDDLKMPKGTNWPLIMSVIVAFIALLDLLLFKLGKVKTLFIPRTILFIFGLLGVAVFLLWFATDHVTTKNNLNLIWASPLYLFFLYRLRAAQNQLAWQHWYFKITAILLTLMVVTGSFWPQSFHPTFYILAAAPLFVSIRIGWGTKSKGKTM